ncbi:MAG: cupin domain-containing protein [Gammaproteobacteria bacterium]|nr:cupin domain-containing protein [Gammaproteobacteria bacterium]
MDKQNLWQSLPDARAAEQFTELLHADNLRIERIVSQGQASPEGFWYDQAEHEWVLLLEGAARLELEGGKCIALKPGDYINLPAHTRHRVVWTDPDKTTIWLAVFYR